MTVTVTAAAGRGWTCKVEPGTARCTRPGTGADTLRAGLGYPPIKVTAAIPAGSAGDTIVPAANSATEGDARTANNAVQHRATIAREGSWFPFMN